MGNDLLASASIDINASPARVWEALVEPNIIRQYMFGTTVISDWQQGSPITWQGEWEGKAYEDKGTILQIEPERLLQYSHYSPLSGAPDVPESYHTVTITLSGEGEQTHVTLTQDNNDNEEARQHSAQNWQMMLDGLKKVVETPS